MRKHPEYTYLHLWSSIEPKRCKNPSDNDENIGYALESRYKVPEWVIKSALRNSKSGYRKK